MRKGLSEFYEAAHEGKCVFCGKRLKAATRRPRRLCGKPRCMLAYSRAYWADHPRPHGLKHVGEVLEHPSKAGWRVLILECGHSLAAPKRMADPGRRRHCTVCKGQEKKLSRTA